MICKGKILGIWLVAAAVLLLLSSIAGWATPNIHDGDPGTIGECLAMPDGSVVTLPAEKVSWSGVSGKSFAIKEWFETNTAQPRLVVTSTQPLPVEKFWTVDVTGTLSTITKTNNSGEVVSQRVIIVSPEDVTVYCDANGRAFMFLPIKNPSTAWSSKRSLAELSGISMLRTSSMFSVMDVPSLPPIPDSPESLLIPPAAGSRDNLKWLPNGAYVQINGVVGSVSFMLFSYVERSDKTFGIWLISNNYVQEGTLVNLEGYMGTSSGERYVRVYSGGVVYLDEENDYPIPTSVGMVNNVVGGGPVGNYTPAVGDGSGLNNTGLIVRTCGKVTDAYYDYYNYCNVFYIDDGSNVAADCDAVGHRRKGIKVYDFTYYYGYPTIGSYETVTGVASSEIPYGETSSIRVIYRTIPQTPAAQTGIGTISGTVTAVGANGKTLKVTCGGVPVTATFVGDSASYTLPAPACAQAVTASVPGYMTTTKLVQVTNAQTVTCNFTLSDIPNIIDVVASEERTAVNGMLETTVTAIHRDVEGRRISNGSITWSATPGTIVSSESTTNAVGEATAVIRSNTAYQETAVTATIGTLSNTCYITW